MSASANTDDTNQKTKQTKKQRKKVRKCISGSLLDTQNFHLLSSPSIETAMRSVSLLMQHQHFELLGPESQWGKHWYTLALGDHPIPFYPCQGLVAMQRGSANKIMQICRHIFAEPSMDS